MEALARIKERIEAGMTPREAYIAEFSVEAWEVFVTGLYAELCERATHWQKKKPAAMAGLRSALGPVV